MTTEPATLTSADVLRLVTEERCNASELAAAIGCNERVMRFVVATALRSMLQREAA